MIDIIINFYLLNCIINLCIMAILVSLDLYNSFHRNRQDFWYIIRLGLNLTFIPIINTLALFFVVYLFVIIPLIEKIFNCKYNYRFGSFDKKQKEPK